MSQLLFEALKKLTSRSKVTADATSPHISEFFGQNVFGVNEMRATLSPAVFKKVTAAIKNHEKIDEVTADAVASAAKSWAINKGATHFTHWFQPMTGGTAEKHDSFFDALAGIERFKGSELVQQEPDASSFPSGGIRSTFEARGYTAWDPTSPMFLYGKTLSIPTIFVSYTGETLDTKSPLLKALKVVDVEATKVCQLFDKDIQHVVASLGPEQEYFALDLGLFNVGLISSWPAGRYLVIHPHAASNWKTITLDRSPVAFMTSCVISRSNHGSLEFLCAPVTTKWLQVSLKSLLCLRK